VLYNVKKMLRAIFISLLLCHRITCSQCSSLVENSRATFDARARAIHIHDHDAARATARNSRIRIRLRRVVFLYHADDADTMQCTI
jgi:hypothetical protein